MSKVILCAGQRAGKPYTVKTSGVRVYTIEELCYCLKKDLDLLDEDMIDREMAVFIKNDLGFMERGAMLEEMVITKADLKSRLVVIFCTCDYFDRDEITELCRELDELASMSGVGRMKRRADKYMADGKTTEAVAQYRAILADPGAHELAPAEYGNVLHNIGIGEIRARSYAKAADDFREAYERNESIESLKCYFYALKLGHNEKLYVSEALRLLDSNDLMNTIENELAQADDRASSSSDYEQIDKLRVLYQQGRTGEFEKLSDTVIMALKTRYRNKTGTML